MIKFKLIRFKNILSYGNTWTTFIFDDARSTVITGKNGVGKSVLIDALTFVLYGKPFRDIRVIQLVNSINVKGLEVQLEFSLYGDNYKIIRARNPGVFEIWVNETLIPQSSNNKDYQRILTNQILRMNYDTFTQIVILGSSSFTPFMKLKPPVRKSIIENLLDISIFSIMNQIVREQIAVHKTELSELEHKIELLDNEYKIKKENELNNKKITDQHIQNINKRIQSYNDVISRDRVSYEELQDHMREITNFSDTEESKKLSVLNEYRIKISGNISRLKKRKKYLEDNDKCTQCAQVIEENHKIAEISTILTQLQELSTGFEKLKETIKISNNNLKQIKENKKKREVLETKMNTINIRINSNLKFLKDLEEDKHKARNKKKNISDENLSEIENDIKLLNKKHSGKQQQTSIFNMAIRILKDDGVKTKVIKYYLPMINHYCNVFLQKLGFSILFEFDENFNEIIKSRYRDTFSYGSFSEGQKTRIDLALLFTWREIAKIKNNASCNILILDEILDGSLDKDGIVEFIDIINETQKSNSVTISHREEATSANFDKNIKVMLRNDFSVMEVVK